MSTTLTKLDIARRQLAVAIRLFFDDRDAISVHTLAANAWEIVDVLCKKREVDSFSRHARENLPDGKSLRRDFINQPYRNFFKHADEDPEGTIDGFSDDKNDHILFLAVDDLQPALGCYGDKLAITPKIDCLAGNGILFNRAYCQSALCNPSRSSLFTGRRPDTTKVWGNRAHFREALPGVLTLPEYFMHHGYHVENIGKMFHGQTYTLDPQSWSVPPRHDLATYNEHYAIPEAGRGKIGASVASPSRPDNAFHDGMVTDDAVHTLQSVKNRQFF